MDGVWHKRCRGGSVENAGVLVAIGVGMDGRREVLSVAEGMKEERKAGVRSSPACSHAG